jgi:hypothetical protein
LVVVHFDEFYQGNADDKVEIKFAKFKSQDIGRSSQTYEDCPNFQECLELHPSADYFPNPKMPGFSYWQSTLE